MISKAVRKMLAVSLAAVMAVGAMAGCGKGAEGADPTKAPDKPEATKAPDKQEGNDAPEATATPTPVPLAYQLRTDENGNVYDLGGIEVVIRDWWSSGERTVNNAYDEARIEYLEWAEDTYNFTIKETAISGWGSMPQDFIDYATTGGDEYYVFTWRQCGELISSMNSGLMYDLSTLDCLDFTEEKWKSGAHELMSKNGGIYGMRGIEPEPRGCMYFNKRLLTEAGIDPESIYELQRNGEWTWAKFEEICEKVQRDVNSDGVIDIYAMVQQPSSFHSAAVYANGGSYIGKDANGKFFNNIESKETIEALNWSTEMIAKYQMPQGEGEWDYFIAAFKESKAVFFADEVYRAGQMINDETRLDDYGMVAFPKNQNNANVKDYISYYNDNIYCIPACYDADKAWKIAFAYDLYTQPIPGFEDYSAYAAGQYGNFCDTEAVEETIPILINSGIPMHHTFVPGIDLGADILWGLGSADAEGNVATAAEKAESLRNTWAAYIDEANK